MKTITVNWAIPIILAIGIVFCLNGLVGWPTFILIVLATLKVETTWKRKG